MAIMDAPGRSYRLDANIALGAITPLGFYPETGKTTVFSGSLDGNGHTVSFSMTEIPGCTRYGLFTMLNNANISSLNVNGKITVNNSDGADYQVGMIAGADNGTSSIGGGTVSGSLDVSGNTGSAVVSGVVGNSYYGTALNSVTTEVDTNVHADGNMTATYYALSNSPMSPRDCYVYGSADLEGNFYAVTIVNRGIGCNISQNLTVRSNKGATVTAIAGGERNYYSGTIEVLPGEGSGRVSVCGIDGGTANTLEGDLKAQSTKNASVSVVMANGGTGHTVNGNVTVSGSGSGSGYGMEYCSSSTMNGNISVFNGSPAIGLYDCRNCIFNGNISLQSTLDYTRVRGAYKGSHNQVNANLSIRSTGDNAGVYGLIECPESGFTGSLSASGPTSAHAVGACNAIHNVVSANITVNSGANGSATGVSNSSSFDGSVSCPGGSVTGCGDDSIAKGSLSGQSVTASGAGGYFSGSIEATYTTGPNKASVSIGGAASGTVTVKGGKNGAFFSPGACFSGSASVTAEDGWINATSPEGGSVSVSHRAGGVSGTVQSIIQKANREDSAEVYWHRYAKEQKCTKDSHQYIEYGYHSYAQYCFQTLMGVGIDKNCTTNPEKLGWDGSIDPVTGTYKPDLDPVNYILKVTDPHGTVIHSCRVSIGGAWYYPDVDGSILVDNGPAVISPLVVELKNGDASYSRVLTRTAYYPVPNMTNTIQLEPNLEQLKVSLVAEGFSGSEHDGSWGGVQVNLLRKVVDLLNNAMEIELDVFDASLKYKKEHLPNGNMGYTVGAGIDLSDQSAKELSKNPRIIAAKLEEMGKMVKLKKGVLKNWVKVAGAELNFAALGYAELALDPETNQWYGVGGQIGATLDGGQRFTYHPPIPYTLGLVYVTGAYNLSGSGNLTLKKEAQDDSVDRIVMNPYGTINLGGALEAAVGIGYRFADVYAEGGGKGQLDVQWEFPHKTAKDSLNISLNFNGFLRSRLLCLGWEYATPSGVFQLWPRNTQSARTLSAEGEYTVLPRTYLTRSRSNGEASAYPYAQLQLLPLADGRYVLIYTDDDISRGDADRSALRAMIGTDVDGQMVWGDPITIENDGTGDYAFTACVSGKEVAVIWQDMDTEFGSGEDLDTAQVTSQVGLSQAILDCGGEIPQVSQHTALPTESGVYESMPMIYYDGNILRSAWVTATENDPTQADENTRYTLWLSEGFGQEGTVAAGDLNSVTGIALLPGDLLWSTQVEDTSDLWLRDADGNVSCQRESGVANLQSIGGRYIFTEGSARFGGSGNFDTCRQEGLSEANQNILRLNGTGDVCYAVPGLDSSRVYRMDGETARPVGEYEGYLSSWDMAGDQVITLLRTGFEETDTASLTTQSVQVLEDVELELYCDNPAAAPGSGVTLTVNVSNEGTYALTELPVQVVMEDGTVLYEQSSRTNVETGESQTLELSFTVPEEFTPQDITVTAAGQSETFRLGGSNLALSADWSGSDAGRVQVTVTNTGHGEASGTVTLTDSDGNVLASQDVTVGQSGEEHLYLDLGEYYTENADLTVTLTEDGDAAESMDNEAFVTVTPMEARTFQVEPYLYVSVGLQQPVGVQTFPAGALVSGLDYSSRNPQIATVSATGKVTGVAVGETTVTVTAPDGTEYPVIVRVTESGDGQLPDQRNPFVDITEDKYYYEPVLWAAEQQITSGVTPNTFGPNEVCTRAQVVTFLWRAAGSPDPASSVNPFADVKTTDYFYKAVLWAVEKGITVGTSNTAFSPKNVCTRAQVATFLYRYDGENRIEGAGNPFTDVDGKAYYYDPIMWAVDRGITVGMTDTTFQPATQCSRAQIVTFLYRYMTN